MGPLKAFKPDFAYKSLRFSLRGLVGGPKRKAAITTRPARPREVGRERVAARSPRRSRDRPCRESAARAESDHRVAPSRTESHRVQRSPTESGRQVLAINFESSATPAGHRTGRPAHPPRMYSPRGPLRWHCQCPPRPRAAFLPALPSLYIYMRLPGPS